MSNFPTAKLTSGMVVKNFGSPHPYTFNDGTILAACERELVEKTMFQRNETFEKTNNGIELVNFNIAISDELIHLLIAECEGCDIILIPAILKDALKSQSLFHQGAANSLVVTDDKEKTCIICSCYTVDRMTKVISATKFYA